MQKTQSCETQKTPAETGAAGLPRAAIFPRRAARRGAAALSLLAAGWLAPLALCADAAGPASFEGQPFVQRFAPRDYQADAGCKSVVQDRRGLMYVANRALVLEYDASTWRKIPVPTFGWVNALAYDASTDQVFVGGDNLLGYLQRTADGARVFVSLKEQIPAEARDFGDIHSVCSTPEGTFFLDRNYRVLRWRDGRFKVWQLAAAGQSGRLRGGWAGGKFYVQNPGVGLRCLQEENFAAACDDPVFRRTTVRKMCIGADGTVVVGTLGDGLFTLRGGTAQPWQGDCAGFLKDQGIQDLLLLRDGSLAVATAKGGLVLFDREGRFRTHLDETGERPGGNLLGLCEDAEGGLWLGSFNGIARAEVNSPLSILRAGPGDDLSNIYCGDLWFGKMVLGNLNGLYRFDAADPATATGAHLERIPGAGDVYYEAEPAANGLLLSTAGKVVLLDAAARIVPVLETTSRSILLRPSTAHPGQFYVGLENGQVRALQLDAATQRWADAGLVVDLGQTGVITGLAESPQGDLWIASAQHGLFHVRPASGGQGPDITALLNEPGPLQGEADAFIWTEGGPVLILTPDKLYRLDERAGIIRPAAEYGSQFVDGSFHSLGVLSYDAHSLWVVGTHPAKAQEGQVYGRVIPGGAGLAPVFQPLPRKIAGLLGQVQALTPLQDAPEKLTTLLITGPDGVVRLDVPRWEAQAGPGAFPSLIRRAATIRRTADAAAGEPQPMLGDALPHARNSVRFEYAAVTYAFGAAVRFQTRLANFGEEGWSDFSDRNSVDYLNLPEGGYTFEVRARDADGRMSSVAGFPFRVLPPWQRTAWAYAAYALLAAAGVYGLVRWQLRRLRARNAHLEQVVAARTGELVHARDAADAANRAKSVFLANMTHELRTPLNAILGYSQILLKDPELSSRNRERVTTVDRSGSHLLSMINEVLDLSKIEAGKLTLLPTHFSLEALLDDLGAAFAPRFAEKQIAFVDGRTPGLPAVIHTDAGKLRQVLFNLLGNALKFTARGEVRLEAAPAAGRAVRFAVLDTGVGIAADELRHIFQAFHQGGDHEASRHGTGLGLSISQRLVELLGGRLEVESTPGRGSRFWFDLDLPPVAATGALLRGGEAGTAHRPVVGFRGPARRLLVVDDEAVNRAVLSELLAPLGFEVEETLDGEECLRRCAERMPDALLLDLRMGRIGGLEVARRLRQQGGAAAAVRIVAVSASVFADDRQQAIAAGCDDFLPKPFREEQLLAVLGAALQIEWITADPATPPPASASPDAGVDAARFGQEIDAMMELARSGDILGLRARFASLRDTGGIPARDAALVQTLEPLLAGYEVDRAYDVLVRFKEDHHG